MKKERVRVLPWDGPWSTKPHGGKLRIVDPQGLTIASVAVDHEWNYSAHARWIAALPDHTLFAAALTARVARWESFSHSPDHGEICMAGLRYSTELDEWGVPALSHHTREKLVELLS